MTSIVIHLSKDADGKYVCFDSVCGASGSGSSPEEAITLWAADVFHGYRFLMGNLDKLSPELDQQRKDVERYFFPSQEDETPCQP